MKTEIRTNDSLTFKGCLRKWYLTSPHRDNLEPRRPVDVFFVGRGIHYALAAMYEHGEDPVAALDTWWMEEMELANKQLEIMLIEEEAMWDELRGLSLRMLQHFKQWAVGGETDMSQWEHVDSEVEYNIPLRTLTGRASPRYCLAGRVDRVVRINGAIWGVEYKTINTQGFGSVSDGRLEKDEQATAYIYALSKKYPEGQIGGMKFVFLKKALPKPPRVLKNGKLSKDKAQDTTLSLYIQAILNMGLGMRNYEDILMHLKEKPNNFFKIISTTRHAYTLEQYQRNIYRLSRDMARVKTIEQAYPTPPWFGCKNCHVKDICDWMDIGLDTHILRAQKYRQRRAWDTAKEKEETAL